MVKPHALKRINQRIEMYNLFLRVAKKIIQEKRSKEAKK
ncbi:hypothetical protein TherJR_0342 [Calderihabitans maritimus]|uniref:Uncharacterized protein n=1 Tax=Calderihabitans maritimus TaxID=1246530 RepID=A0A1Z5HQI2_9FIRM|nr:hypothetical protein TherJR_0342 [Calderihabitans maritimus]